MVSPAGAVGAVGVDHLEQLRFRHAVATHGEQSAREVEASDKVLGGLVDQLPEEAQARLGPAVGNPAEGLIVAADVGGHRFGIAAGVLTRIEIDGHCATA